MPQRRTFRDAGHFYDPLREGLPEAIHKTLFETQDIADAMAWLRDGTMPNGNDEAPPPGTRLAQRERFLIGAVGVSEDGSRWIEAKRQQYQTVEELTKYKWDNDFVGFEARRDRMRGQVRTTGRGNSRRYHVWWRVDDDGATMAESIQLFRYERPASIYEMDPEDPPREALPLNDTQRSIVKLLTER